jgi:hypothetical protein
MKILSDHQLFPSRKVINTLVQKRLFGFCASAVFGSKILILIWLFILMGLQIPILL